MVAFSFFDVVFALDRFVGSLLGMWFGMVTR